MKNKNLTLQFSSLVVATASFVVMGGALLFSQNLKSVLTLWGEDIQMTVYLSQEISPTQQSEIEQKLRKSPHVRDVSLVTQEKALNDFRVQLATYAPDLVKDDELLKLIPSSFQVDLEAGLNSNEKLEILKSIAEQSKKYDGVDEVSYGQDWVQKYTSFVNVIQIIIQMLGVIIVSSSVFVMSNVVRALVDSKRQEIEVLELIGATPFMIRKPFLIEGAKMGLLASSSALFICFGVFSFLKNILQSQLSFLQIGNHIQFLNWSSIAIFILVGLILGAIGSYLCVRKINNGWSASQRV